MASKQANPAFSAYAEEVSAHLGMMKVGEIRGVGNLPKGMQKTYLTYYLNKDGWELNYHYRTFKTGRCNLTKRLLPETPNLIWFEKVKEIKVRGPRLKK